MQLRISMYMNRAEPISNNIETRLEFTTHEEYVKHSLSFVDSQDDSTGASSVPTLENYENEIDDETRFPIASLDPQTLSGSHCSHDTS